VRYLENPPRVDPATRRPFAPRSLHALGGIHEHAIEIEQNCFGLEGDCSRRLHQGIAVLLTNDRRLLSGDHEGTLMVPWPP